MALLEPQRLAQRTDPWKPDPQMVVRSEQLEVATEVV